MTFFPRKSSCKHPTKFQSDYSNFKYNGKLALIGISLTISYITMGIFLFFYIEDCLIRDRVDVTEKMLHKVHKFCVKISQKNSSELTITSSLVKNLSKTIIEAPDFSSHHNVGCNVNRNSIAKWLEFAIATIHTIGYGDIVPRTDFGKLAVILYSMIGIPLAIFQYTHVGNTILCIIKCLIKYFEIQILKRKTVKHLHGKQLLCTLLFFIGTFVSAAAITNHPDLEDYSWLDSFYFWWITLSTIGYGDKSLHLQFYFEHHPSFVLVVFGFVIIGLSLIATTISAILNLTTSRAKKFNIKRRTRKDGKGRETNSCCCFCFKRKLNTIEEDLELHDITPSNRESYLSIESHMACVELNKKNDVIENGNRCDSQRSVIKLFSDVENSDGEDHYVMMSCGKEELQNPALSPKMVTAAVASRRSLSKL